MAGRSHETQPGRSCGEIDGADVYRLYGGYNMAIVPKFDKVVRELCIFFKA